MDFWNRKQEERGPRRKPGLDRATVAQFSLVAESEVPGMWTTGRLSKLTGIPTRTLQEWSKSPEAGARRKTSGSGILPSKVNRKNGYRLFGKDALYDILAIKLAKEAGLRDAQIREITMAGTKGRPMSDIYIERLLHERREIDRRIEIARAISFVERTKRFSCHDEYDAEGEEAIEGLMASELIESIASHLIESKHDEDGENTRHIEGESWKAGIEALERLWRCEESPTGREAMDAVETMHRSLRGIPYPIARAAFSSIATEWASKGYTRIVLALRADEGFLSFFEQAVSAYGASPSPEL